VVKHGIRRENSEVTQRPSGLTRRSFLAILYALIVFQPAVIWIYLMTYNTGLVAGTTWTTLLLFAELVRLGGRPLTKQEGTIIFLVTGITGICLYPVQFLYALYFKNSPIASSFGIKDLIPAWYAPPSSEFFRLHRSFLHPEWTLPIIVSLSYLIFGLLADLALGLFARELFIVQEKLEFPLQRAAADAVITLTERSPIRLRIFMLSSFVSLIYSIMLYALPFITQSIGFSFSILPIPWVDYNPYLHMIVPGASFGISTDILLITTGFIVPFNVCVSMFIGSFTLYFIGNYLLVNFGLTQFAQEWRPGMTTTMSWERSLLYAWFIPSIGFAAAVGILPLIRHPTVILNTFRRLRGTKGGSSYLYRIFILFLAGALGSSILSWWLVPGFPFWIFVLLSVGWSFILALITGRAIGVTGLSINVPYVREFSYIFSGYKGIDIWLVSPYIGSGTGWLTQLKVVELCDTSPSSYIKAWLLAYPIALGLSFFYTEQFWRIAPIPSSVYPGTLIFWPTEANIQAIWLTRNIQIFQPALILYSFGIASVLYLLVDFFHLPLSTIGVVSGLYTPIPTAVTILIGALAGKILERKLRFWRQYRVTVVAGMSMGQSVALVLGGAIAMIVRSMWTTPY